MRILQLNNMKYLIILLSTLFLFSSCKKDAIFDPENPKRIDFFGDWEQTENTCESTLSCNSFDDQYMRGYEDCDNIPTSTFEWRISGGKIITNFVNSTNEVSADYVFENENLIRFTNNNGCHILMSRL